MSIRFSESGPFQAIGPRLGSAAASAVRFLSRGNRAVGPYLAETGRVTFTAVAVFGVLAAVAEIARPGFVINWLAPGEIAAAGLLTGLLSLWPSGPDTGREMESATVGRQPRPRTNSWRTGALGLTYSVFAGLGAWYYFIPMAADRLWLSLTAAVIAGATFILFSNRLTYE